MATPYGRSGPSKARAGFMGKEWDGGDIAFRPDVWREVLRVLKPGGFLLSFGGTRTYHRMACAIEDAGFEIRDSITDLIASDTFVAGFLASLNDEQRGAFARCIDESQFGGILQWVFGSGFPKSLNVSAAIDKAAGAEREIVGHNPKWNVAPKAMNVGGGDRDAMPAYTAPATEVARQWSGFGTALKPACEPIVLARKPLSEGTVAANVLKWGTGALNIDGCRVEHVTVNGGNLADNPHLRESIKAGRAENLSSFDLSDHKIVPHTSGRWPANAILDSSEQVQGAFPETTSGARSNADGERGAFGGDTCYGDTKSGRTTKNSFDSSSGSAARFFYTAKADQDTRLGSKHPTVKPLSLIQYLVRLVGRKDALILDPFAGTGTLGEACIREGMRAVLIEREAEYQDDIRRRMKLAMSGRNERSHEAMKARNKDKPVDHGPLFGLARRNDDAAADQTIAPPS